MRARTGILAVAGSICMTLALVLAWMALALKPDLPQKPTPPFGALMVLSVATTTVGYGGAAWYVAHTGYLVGELMAAVRTNAASPESRYPHRPRRS
jgi:hypothetical protein